MYWKDSGPLFSNVQCHSIDLCQSTYSPIQCVRHGDLNSANTPGRRNKKRTKCCVFYKKKLDELKGLLRGSQGQGKTYVSSFYLSAGVLSLCFIGIINRICSNLYSFEWPSFCCVRGGHPHHNTCKLLKVYFHKFSSCQVATLFKYCVNGTLWSDIHLYKRVFFPVWITQVVWEVFPMNSHCWDQHVLCFLLETIKTTPIYVIWFQMTCSHSKFKVNDNSLHFSYWS